MNCVLGAALGLGVMALALAASAVGTGQAAFGFAGVILLICWLAPAALITRAALWLSRRSRRGWTYARWGAIAWGGVMVLLTSPSFLGDAAGAMFGLSVAAGAVFGLAGALAAAVAWRLSPKSEESGSSDPPVSVSALIGALAGLVVMSILFFWAWGLSELDVPEGFGDFAKVQLAGLIVAPLIWTLAVGPAALLTVTAVRLAHGAPGRRPSPMVVSGLFWSAPGLFFLIAQTIAGDVTILAVVMLTVVPASGGVVSAWVSQRMQRGQRAVDRTLHEGG